MNSNTNAIGLKELHQAYVDTYVRSYNHTTVVITCVYIHFRVTSYVDQMSAWYDVKTKQEVINIKVFEKLEVRIWICFNLIEMKYLQTIGEFTNVPRFYADIF